MNTWMAAIGALITLIAGLFIGNKIKRSPKVPDASSLGQAKDVLNDHAEAVEEAGEDLADSMAADSSGRVRRVLDWYKRRKGAGSTD